MPVKFKIKVKITRRRWSLHRLGNLKTKLEMGQLFFHFQNGPFVAGYLICFFRHAWYFPVSEWPILKRKYKWPILERIYSQVTTGPWCQMTYPWSNDQITNFCSSHFGPSFFLAAGGKFWTFPACSRTSIWIWLRRKISPIFSLFFLNWKNFVQLFENKYFMRIFRNVLFESSIFFQFLPFWNWNLTDVE